MRNIILIAPPAAGKGTEATLIKEEFNVPHISTGDLLRNATLSDNPKFKQVKEVLKNGQLVSDEIVLELLKDRIMNNDCTNGYILDGFPRNVEQAKAYDLLLKSLDRKLGIVVVLDIDKSLAKSRITGRVSCPKCGSVYNTNEKDMRPINEGICDKCSTLLTKRSDDNAETYEQRYNEYLQKTEPLINYYEKLGVVYHVDASKNKEFTHNEVKKLLGSINND